MYEPLANSFFRILDKEEEQEFRTAAREKYELGTVVNGLFHPAYRAECELMNLEENRVVGAPTPNAQLVALEQAYDNLSWHPDDTKEQLIGYIKDVQGQIAEAIRKAKE